MDKEIAVEDSTRWQPAESPHGTNGRYTAGCHCVECKAAHAQYMKGWRGLPDSAIERIVKRAGKLTPAQVEKLRSLLPEPAADERAS